MRASVLELFPIVFVRHHVCTLKRSRLRDLYHVVSPFVRGLTIAIQGVARRGVYRVPIFQFYASAGASTSGFFDSGTTSGVLSPIVSTYATFFTSAGLPELRVSVVMSRSRLYLQVSLRVTKRLLSQATTWVRVKGQFRRGDFFATSSAFSVRNVGFCTTLQSVVLLRGAIGNIGTRVITYDLVLLSQVSRAYGWVRGGSSTMVCLFRYRTFLYLGTCGYSSHVD